MAVSEWVICRTANQNNVKILLCDDDPGFLQAIHKELVRAFSKLNRKIAFAEFRSPMTISSELLAACDMAFLDIDFESEECNGIDIARKLRQVNDRALIFFVTNYIDYAPTGYEVQAFRYILKRDLDEVLERYILQAMENIAEVQAYLRLSDRDQTVDLPLDQIVYLEVLDHYVSVHASNSDYTIAASLSSLESELEVHGFLRIHKSYLVNMLHIRKFRSRECMLSDGTLLAVSEKNYSQQKQKYLLWKGLK